MKRFLFFFLALTSACVCSAADKEFHVRAGHLDTYANFPSKYVPARYVRVWTPEDYTSSQKYDVLYLHDGQMLFDADVTWNHQEWGVDEVIDSLIRRGEIRPTIVVGIDYNPDNRVGEYCPDDVKQLLPKDKEVYATAKAQGNDYLRFLVEEVKPFIDSVYSTHPEREHTWTLGSSCGGLISSYALCKYPEIFGGAACMSTHSIFAYPLPDDKVQAAYRKYLQLHLIPNKAKLYMDRGNQTLDGFYRDAQDAINAMLWAEGWDNAHFQYRYYPEHNHCENDWRARLDDPLKFLLAK